MYGLGSRLVTIMVLAAATSAHGGVTLETTVGCPTELRSAELTVTVDCAPLRVTVSSAAGTLLQELPDPTGATLKYVRDETSWRLTDVVGEPVQIGNRVELTVGTDEDEALTALVAVEFRDDGAFFVELVPPMPETVTEVVEVFAAPEGERYYGLTERIVTGRKERLDPASEIAPQAVGSLDRRGELVYMSVAATIAVYTPFYHSSRGYGVFVDGTMEGTYDIANADPGALEMRFNFDPTQQRFRYHIFHGPSHARILDHYTTLTGRPWLPPRWAYQHMRWRDEHAKGEPVELDGVAINAAVAEDLMMYDSLGFPMPGWYTLDRPWAPASETVDVCPSPSFVTHAWDEERFPNPQGMVDLMVARGIHPIVWDAPWACGDPDNPAHNAHIARESDYLAPNSNAVIDFTNPDAVAWWQAQFADFIEEFGLFGFKLDRGDEIVPVTAEDVYFDGRNGLEMHNEYPRLFMEVYHDALQARMPNEWITVTRPGYAGSQALGTHWGGDTTGANNFGFGAGTDLGLRSALISGQRMAFMGFPNWGTDTGGYYQFKQRDVFARWLQFSAFSPIMEIGGGRTAMDSTGGPHAPWAMPTEPTVDEEMIAIYRFYTWLHHELVPYSYSEGIRANETGHPIITPLVFEYPDDSAVGDLWDQFLYGPWLLVAPVWENGARARDVYLPADGWTDLWNDAAVLEGPVSLDDVPVPLDRIPVYVKLGAILPLEVINDATGHGTASSAEYLTLAVWPHGSSAYTLREAAGELRIESDKEGAYRDVAPVAVTIAESTRRYILRVKTNFRPAAVTQDSQPLLECATPLAFDDPEDLCHWLYETGGRVIVRLESNGAATVVEFTPGDPALCGNDVIDAGEECDDGNALDGDGCDAFCREELVVTPPCPGDCDGDGAVSVAELIRGVNIALGNDSVDVCPAFDGNADGSVSIAELIQAVNAALEGCPAAA